MFNEKYKYCRTLYMVVESTGVKWIGNGMEYWTLHNVNVSEPTYNFFNNVCCRCVVSYRMPVVSCNINHITATVTALTHIHRHIKYAHNCLWWANTFVNFWHHYSHDYVLGNIYLLNKRHNRMCVCLTDKPT